jgi:glycosyltransferase involved in cell wall biosynthesis
MLKSKLVVVATHPIQYHAPWYRELAKQDNVDLIVLFGMRPNAEQQSTGFGTTFSWDIPLTEGYQWQQLENKSADPNLFGFSGVDCPGIYQALKQLSPDAITITGWHSKLLFQALWAAKRLGVKTIMRGDSNAKKPRRWYVHLAHRLLLARYDAFLAVGHSNRHFFLNNGVAPQSIFRAPYFIENQRFIDDASLDESTDSVEPARTLPSDDFCFVYAGKLILKKNVQELLSAFALSYRENQRIQMLIIGDGELRDELETYVAKHQLPVSFFGFINQKALPKTYALGDCFVLGSDYDETWGLVVNEAMACGLPAIVSNRAGSSDDLIIEGKTGYVYQYGATQELSKKMLLMASNKDQVAQMGQYAKEHVVNNFNVQTTVQATLDALAFID